MSWQAQTAVNHHSKVTDMKLFRLLLYLAECANDNGRIDPAPNQDTLAEFYGVTSRTIRNWLNVLCDSGELEQTRVGSGPGNPSAYQIALPMPDKGGNKAEANTADASIFGSFMVEIKAEIDDLKAEILALKVEKVETKGGKGGNERRKDHSFKNADDPYDPSFDPEEENIYIPQAHDLNAQFQTELATVAKEPLSPGFNEKKYEDAAFALMGWDAELSQVAGFADYWKQKGWHPNQPSLTNVVNHWRDYLAGNVLGPGANGAASKERTEKTFALVDEHGNEVDKVVLNV